jgi:soluble lytic murein transglycosylase
MRFSAYAQSRLALAIMCLGMCLGIAVPAGAERTQPSDVEHYQDAMRAFNRGFVNEGLSRLEHLRSPLLRKVALGNLLAQPDTPYDFAQISAFVQANPTWPELDAIKQRAEEKMPPTLSATAALAWLEAYPPISLAGFHRWVGALRDAGEAERVPEAVRTRWIEGSFGAAEQQDFLIRYGTQLRPQEHWARLDRLLWNNTDAAAERMLPLVSDGQAALARARMNLTASTLARVPDSLQRDPGLLYLQLKRARQNDDDDREISLLALQPAEPPEPELWVTERVLLARRLLLAGQDRNAYQVAARHRLGADPAAHQAEFLAGWIALRFLRQPTTAITHFMALYEQGNLPITKARGAYWLGRAYAAQNAATTARSWFAKAALYPTTFYGQLAQAALEDDTSLTIEPQAIDSATRAAFTARDTVQIAALLNEIGERKRAESFVMAMANAATTAAEFALLAQLATKQERYELAVKISKLATKAGFLLNAEAYPLPPYQLRDTPERALVLGLIRQESMFNPSIVSPAQAQGLMQLLPSTARATARSLDMSFSAERLSEPNYNIRLGSRFLADRIAQFDGAWIMAIASYNAGPARVRQWLDKIGDPRFGRMDPIDWIELIPVYETRNYVQRVLEATQIYRARLNNGQAPLRIVQDVRSGRQ